MKHPCLPTAAAVLFSFATLCGQTIVSPVQAQSAEGNSASAAPFLQNRPSRYMQLHGDIPAFTQRFVTKLRFRQQAGDKLVYTGVTAIELELFMGTTTGSYANPSLNFLENYSSARQNKIARKTINFGPQGQNTTSGPNPFVGMDLVLDSAFRLVPGTTLVWEVVMHSGVQTGTVNVLDAETGSNTKATGTVTGNGCTAIGKPAPMVLVTNCFDNAGTLGFGATVNLGPASAPCLFAIGFTNPDLAIPGLCSNVLTSLDIVMPMGTTSTSGTIDLTAGFGMFIPNPAPGLTVFTQAHALEPARPDAFPICNSRGDSTKLPPVIATNVVKVTRLFANLPTDTRASFSPNTCVGNGLVVGFD